MPYDKIYYDTSEANNIGVIDVEPDPTIATPSNVKSQYLYKNPETTEILIGTMPINPDVNIKIDPKDNTHTNNSYKIPAGYHTGNSKVYVGNLSEYTVGNATPEEVINNKVFWVNGERKVGILNPGEITQEGTATADDIVYPKTAWVNKTKLTGTINKLPRQDKTLLAGESYTYPKGLSAGTSVISAASLASQTPGTATEDKVGKGLVAWVNGNKVTGTFDIDEEIIKRLSESNATQDNVLFGKKFYSSAHKQIVSGQMPDHTGEPQRTINIGSVYNIPRGFYDGNSQITTQSLSDATRGTADAEHILKDKTAWRNGEKLTGTMPNNTSEQAEISAGQTYHISRGYHNGSGTVVAKGLSPQTEGTAVASDIKYDKTAWVNGSKLTGTMPINSSEQREIGLGETYIIANGYHSGTGTLWTRPLGYYTQGTATSNDLIYNKTAWVNGSKITGTIPVIPKEDKTLSAGESYNISIGYHKSTSKITAKDLASQTVANADKTDILINKTAWVNGNKVTGTLELTGDAVLDDVLAGKTFYNINAKSRLTGTLAFSGNAMEENVLKGKTFYSDDPKRKLTGTLELTGDATSEKVLVGNTFYNTDPSNRIIGTMPNIGSVTKEVTSNEVYIIPKGYHDGTGKVTGSGLGPQTEGTADKTDILKDKTAWVNGEKITGTLELTGDATSGAVLSGFTFYNTDAKTKVTGSLSTVEPVTRTLSAGESLYIEQGFHTGNGRVIAKDLASQTEATAIADNILATKTAWVNGEKLIGTMPNNESFIKKNILADDVISIPLGYHNGSGYIQAASLASQTVANAVSGEILETKTAWVNGNKITGSMQNHGAVSKTLAAGDSYNIPVGFHNGGGTILTKSLYDQTRANATSENLLITKTAWVNGEKINGTMPNNESWSKENIPCGETYNIPLGYHNGMGVISTKSLSSQTVADAVKSELFVNRTAWVNGEKITGTMPDNSNWNKLDIEAGKSYNIPLGYHNGLGVVSAKSLASQTVADAVNTNILINKTAWVNGVKITGNMPDNSNWEKVNMLAGEEYTIPLGYHDGAHKVSAKDLASQTVADATAGTILSPYTAWVNGSKITGTISTQTKSTVRISAGNQVQLAAGYYPSGILIYSLYTDRLDLTGTDAEVINSALHPNSAGYVDASTSTLVITAEVGAKMIVKT